MSDPNPKNRQVSFSVVQYGSGPWNGKWVVRQTTTEDVAATLSKPEADHLAQVLSEKDVRS